MIFACQPLQECEGAILAHTLRGDGRVFKKGTVLHARDIAALRAAGYDEVTVARLEADDQREDAVARTIAGALAEANVGVGETVAGRCNLRAEQSGVLSIDVAAVDRLNGSGDGILLATLPADSVVEAGRTVATLKVVPYAVSKARCDDLVGQLAGGALRVLAFREKRVALILSRVADMKDSLLDKAREVLAARVETYGGVLVEEARCAHTTAALARAIEAAAAKADIVLLLGAASAVDMNDTVPAAIAKAGGAVDVFGVPLDPGNLLVSARLADVPVLGLPGCARSPKLNGTDLVLPFLFADAPLERAALLGMGVGGLLHDVAERPQPREVHRTTDVDVDSVGAVVLAGGSSKRMGEDNKLLQEVDGKAMVRRVVEAALDSHAVSVIVVTGHEAVRVRQALAGLDVTFVHNPNYADGLSTSVRAGVGHVPTACGGAVMLLGDMPRVTAGHIDVLLDRFRDEQGRAICVPTCGGRRGNPVVWPRDFFADMMDLDGDVGARRLIERHRERVVEVAIEDRAIFLDVDTPDDLEAI